MITYSSGDGVALYTKADRNFHLRDDLRTDTMENVLYNYLKGISAWSPIMLFAKQSEVESSHFKVAKQSK